MLTNPHDDLRSLTKLSFELGVATLRNELLKECSKNKLGFHDVIKISTEVFKNKEVK